MTSINDYEKAITIAKPHTIKKFELIEKYVDEWARKILGYSGKGGFAGSKGIIFIDCMSNSGVYKDDNGTYIDGTAIRVVKILNQISKNYPGKKIVLYFNDISSECIEILQAKLSSIDHQDLEIHISTMDCNDFLKQFNLTKYGNYNTLMIYDPYEAIIDWDAVAPFLNTWGEVFINHMVSDTARGAALAKKEKTIKKYQDTYQKKISDVVAVGNDADCLNEIIEEIIKEQSKKSSTQYIASFPFFNSKNGKVYNLIHCSRHIKGLVLFKKIAWQTFGGKSSLKDTHGKEVQMRMDFSGEGTINTETDCNCYYVKDIAKYVYKKYHLRGSLLLDEIYYDLDRHPIFPSEGFKPALKKELKYVYNVSFTRDKKIVFN